MVPHGWDFEHDLFVLWGEDADVIRSLLAAGQKRVVLFGGSPVPAMSAIWPVQSIDHIKPVVDLHWSELPGERVVTRISPAFSALVDAAALEQAARDALQGWQSNWGMWSRHGERWLLQRLANMAYLAVHPTVSALGGAFSGRPAFLISPGPSLEKNGAALAEYKGRAVLIASAQALGALKRLGVIPDIVVVLDYLDLKYLFDGVKFDQIGALVLSYDVHPDLFDLPTLRFGYSGNAGVGAWSHQFLGERCELPGGGSVACTAFSLALELGCSSLALVGQDLALSDGKMYATGASHGQLHVRIKDDGTLHHVYEGFSSSIQAAMEGHEAVDSVRLPGYYGGQVLSQVAFGTYRRWFCRIARDVGSERKLFNCTEGGAFIDGMIHRPLTEFAREFCVDSFSVAEVLADRTRRFDRRARYDRVNRHVCALKTLLDGQPYAGPERAACESLIGEFQALPLPPHTLPARVDQLRMLVDAVVRKLAGSAPQI